MKKQDLLRIIDNELLEELFGFCYTRTKDSYEAEELCSDIVFALIKAACSNGEIENLYPFIWKVARNVYADFSDRRRKHTDMFYEGDSETVLPFIADEEDNDQSEELLDAVYRQIAFLTKAYREVMILFYLDGLSTAEIAVRQNISETAVRQRLFSARKRIKSEVKEMTETYPKPVVLDRINYVIWGEGNPCGNDPRTVCTRQFSKHVVYMCYKHKDNEEQYLTFPYLNRKIDQNLVLWQQIVPMVDSLIKNVEKDMEERYFSRIQKKKRPFYVYGYIDNGKYFGSGWDGVNAENVCGYSKIRVDNIYTTQVRAHFHCGLNLANDIPIQLALRAIDGLNIGSLTEAEKEYAAMAVSCGYLYREGEMLYTKILVNRLCDSEKLYDISQRLEKGCFEKTARIIADKMAKLIYDCVPDYLLSEWKFANRLASLPVIDSVVEALIEKGMLVPPEDGVGAEGCWMGVEK